MTERGTRILIIDSDRLSSKMIKTALTKQGYEVDMTGNGMDGLDHVALFHPDIILLDMVLPDIDGLFLLIQMRKWTIVPVLVISADREEADMLSALEAGADDYIMKPFSEGELLARIRVALRHVSIKEDQPELSYGGLSVDLGHKRVTVDGKEIKLTPTEFEILKYLTVNTGKVLTHRQLLKLVWGDDHPCEEHYIQVYIGQIRRKIERDPENPEYIFTETGSGYRLGR